jgi:hypothetical protein
MNRCASQENICYGYTRETETEGVVCTKQGVWGSPDMIQGEVVQAAVHRVVSAAAEAAHAKLSPQTGEPLFTLNRPRPVKRVWPAAIR